MMIRALTVSILFAVLAAPAYAQDSAQTNPETRQTDQSEEDWRKSRKKRDSGDIFDDIVTNPNNTGSGGIWGGEVKAIDRLNPESRRHLNRLRAKALAEAGPGEPIDAAFEPSDAAKSDEYIARQEEKAWDDMVREANSGLSGIGEAPSQGQGAGGVGDSTDPAQTGISQGGATGGPGNQGQTGRSGGAQSPSTNSPLRGGSAASASDILNQIKGRGPAAGSASGQDQGESQKDQSPTVGQSQQGSTSGDEGSAQAEGQAQANTAGKQGEFASSDSAPSSSDAQSAEEAQAAADSAAQAAAHAETISPLERLKRDPVDRTGTGGQTSASDYLKRKNN